MLRSRRNFLDMVTAHIQGATVMAMAMAVAVGVAMTGGSATKISRPPTNIIIFLPLVVVVQAMCVEVSTIDTLC